MKALKIVFSSMLVLILIAAVAFSCSKQVETEESSTIDGHSVKEQKATCCQPPRQNFQITLQTGVCIEVCIDCSSLKNGYIETCFNYCGADPNCDCNYGNCCPFPLHIEYWGPEPVRPNPSYWRWATNPPRSGGMTCPCAINLQRLTGGKVSTTDLLQIVKDPKLAHCFQ